MKLSPEAIKTSKQSLMLTEFLLILGGGRRGPWGGVSCTATCAHLIF